MTTLDTLSFSEACRQAASHAQTISKHEIVSVTDALGRILSRPITATKNLPSFNNSAMDGFAFQSENAGKRLRVARTIFAGDTPTPSLQAGECYRIMTGAQLPDDVDTVVPIEHCTDVTEEAVTIPADITAGSNFRKKGEELEAGAPLFETGYILRAADIALLSAQGIMAVEVFMQPSIAIVSTGNEIKEPWEDASEDEIYNANAFGISALLKSFGFSPAYVGRIPDDLEASKAFIKTLKTFDVVITTGGISMGDADFLYEAFLANGLEPIFHGISLKPGRPTMMGTMGNTFVMAMPGNPLTTMLTVHAISIPVLYKIAGANACWHTFCYAEFAHDLKLKSGRTNIVIGTMESGVFIPTRNNKIGSGMLTPLAESNAVAYFSEEIGSIEREDLIKVVLFNDRTRSMENRTINQR
ncbi:MAG: molybdopterin molybdotransferase MoeA [Sulfurovum sp.]|nr:molybdopterin molybdotransferase MoeA [Sulfurovum sp.]